MDSQKLVSVSRRYFSTLSLQNLTESLRGLPGLFAADVGIAHRGADILVAEKFLDFPKILPHMIEQDYGRRMPQSVGGDLPHPEGSASHPQTTPITASVTATTRESALASWNRQSIK